MPGKVYKYVNMLDTSNFLPYFIFKHSFSSETIIVRDSFTANITKHSIGKTKRRLHDRKTEYSKALAKSDHSSAIADHVKTTGHDIKWDHFDILASGKTDFHCKIKETLLIQELKPSLNVKQ